MQRALNPPSIVSWTLALVVGVVGIIVETQVLKVRLGIDPFWLVTGAFVLLLVATRVRGM